jgi:hypothetical protein
MPTKAAVREMLPAEAVDLREEVLLLEELARLAQGQRGEAARKHHAALLARSLVVGWELLGADVAAGLAQDQDPLDHVAELTDVAGPEHGLQERARVLAQAAQRQALGAVEHADEVLGQERDVLAPLLERGDVDGHHVQAVEQLLPERAPAMAAVRSRLVEEITRMSTWTFSVPPTRANCWSTSTRRILDWVASGMSATSSK